MGRELGCETLVLSYAFFSQELLGLFGDSCKEYPNIFENPQGTQDEFSVFGEHGRVEFGDETNRLRRTWLDAFMVANVEPSACWQRV